MSVVELVDLTAGYGGRPLLEGVTLRIEPGERVAIMGRNGVGKSTLLKVVGGELAHDDGAMRLGDQVRIATLPQEVPSDLVGTTVREVVRSGIGDVTAMLTEYTELSGKMAEGLTKTEEHRLDDLQRNLDRLGGWETDSKVDAVLTRMDLHGDDPFDELSSGRKRRVLLARSLVSEPDLLLLDEPTNHLDIESINWLEGMLQKASQALLFITHDRAFLRSLATRIVEIDRAKLYDWTCDYETFLKRKAEAIAAEEQQQALFDKKLAQEEVWIRQGIKARRTRNEGRVRRLIEMRRQRQERRSKMGTAKMGFQEADRSGNLVLKAEHLHFSYGSETVIDDVSLTLTRGDRVGLVGPNGCGKSTLLKLLLGERQPDSGSVRLGTNLNIAYFDQLREQIDPTETAQENVAEGKESVTIGGKDRHVLSYLQDFLFAPDRARTLAKYLSGGERNRLLLAKLFLKPANLLVMDEPTNDLDLETLELLEERLLEFPGTLLLVSHDRDFLNHVVTSTLAFVGDGTFREYDGGYDDYLRQSAADNATRTVAAPKQTATPTATKPVAKPKGEKLSYREQQELDRLPEQIEELEQSLKSRHAEMASPDFYKRPADEITTFTTETEELQNTLDEVFMRWEELEEKREGG